MESEVDLLFTVELVTIYEEVCTWSRVIGEVLICHHDTQNHHDPFVIATRMLTRGTKVVSRTRT